MLKTLATICVIGMLPQVARQKERPGRKIRKS